MPSLEQYLKDPDKYDVKETDTYKIQVKNVIWLDKSHSTDWVDLEVYSRDNNWYRCLGLENYTGLSYEQARDCLDSFIRLRVPTSKVQMQMVEE